ncbi:unnamed protein product, partial [Brachionus calyciflorus]
MINCFRISQRKASRRTLKEDESVNIPLIVSEISVHSENENNYKNEIKSLIKDIEDENLQDIEIITKLKLFIEQSGTQIKKSFLEAQTGYDNFYLLHYAAKTCRAELCKYLVDELGYDIDIRSKSKLTPLHLLVKLNILPKISDSSLFSCNTHDLKKEKFVETFEQLIDHNCDYNAVDETKFSAMHYAVSKNNYEAAVLLLELENIKIDLEDENLLNPLHLAFKYGHDDIANLIIEKSNIKSLISTSTETLPIHLACRQKKDNHQLIKKILDKLKSESLTDFVNILNKPDMNKTTILQIAIENNHLQTVDSLLKEYYQNSCHDDIRLEDRNGNLPIHYAARYCGAEMLRVLIKNKFFTNKQNSNLDNPLHIAASNNRYKFIREYL